MMLYILAFTSAILATNYMVGPGLAHQSLQSVVSLLNPGDTVFVTGDTSYSGGVVFTRPGSLSNPIVISGMSINGRRPLLRGATNTVHFSTPWPYSGGGADNYIFENFEITEGTFRGIFLQANNLHVRNVKVFNCPAHGILAADQGSGNITLEGVEIYGCGNGSSQHQIYVTTDQVHFPGSVFRMFFCYLHDAKGGNNVKSRAERNEIFYNWIEGAYYHELELIGPDPGGLSDLPAWSPELKREDSEVMGNVLIKKATAFGNSKDFSVMRLGGDGTGETNGRYLVCNNTIISGSGAVFRLFDGLESVAAFNNVIHRENGAPNIMRNADAIWSTGSQIFAGKNNWVTSGSTNIPTGWTSTFSSVSQQFVSITFDSLLPLSSSQLINNGTVDINEPSGHLFPSPVFPPLFMPPLKKPLTFTTALQRVSTGNIDIGAFERREVSIAESLHAANNRLVPHRFKFSNKSICVQIEESFLREGINSIKVYSLNGRRISIDKADYSSGIYFVKFESKKKNSKFLPFIFD